MDGYSFQSQQFFERNHHQFGDFSTPKPNSNSFEALPSEFLYEHDRASFSSFGSAVEMDDWPSTHTPTTACDASRGRSTSSASAQTALSSFYDCSPVMLDAPLPISAHAGAGQGYPSHSQAEASSLITNLERQASQQGRTVPGVSFGGPPSARVSLDDVVEGRHRSQAQSPAGARKRSPVVDPQPNWAPTPKRLRQDQPMPPTPDSTPSTFTLPSQPASRYAYVYPEQAAQTQFVASAVPRSMSMSVSRTLNYGAQHTQTHQFSVHPGVARAHSFHSLQPEPSASGSSSSAYTITSNSAGQTYEGIQHHQGYFDQQQQQHVSAQPEFPPTSLASPMSLPIDRGQFVPFGQHSPYPSSAPTTPHASPQYNQHQPQYFNYNYAAQSSMSPGETYARRPSTAGTAVFTPTQPALILAPNRTRMIATRFPPTPDTPNLYTQPALMRPPIAISTANLARAQPQPHSYPLPQPSPRSAGPIEGIHPRYRDDLKPSASVRSRKTAEAEEKTHGCAQEGCGKRFKRLEHLRRHERTHTQDRPYACEFEGCGRFFSRSDNLTQHRKTHLRQINGTDKLHGTQPPSSPEPGW